jgi:hypothetical protein
VNLDTFINDKYPIRLDLQAVADRSVTVSQDERRLITYVERLREEAIAWQDELDLETRTARAYEFLAGQQIITRREKDYRMRVTANFFHSVVERKAGMNTDQVPQFEVTSRSGLDIAAMVMEMVTQALWDERNGQDMLATGIIQACLTGSAPTCVLWDDSLDFGLGDVRLDVLPPGSLLVDRRLRRAAALQDNAQYVIVDTPHPLAEICEMYPTGYMVKADPGLSSFRSRKGPVEARSPYGRYTKPSARTPDFRSSAIPYATVSRCYFRDYSLDPSKPKDEEGRRNYLFPRKRVIAWSGNVPLYDGHATNWDGRFPFEILDWGIETQHPYGESEIDNLASVQNALNVLLSGVVNNAVLINDPPLLVDENALDPEELQALRRIADKPGHVHVKQPGLNIERWEPGQMHPIVFQTIQMLQQSIETISGITPVTRGEQPGRGITSGVAIESLMESAQITIRRQQRAIRGYVQRIGQLMLNRIIQYFPPKRILHLTTDRERTLMVLWEREKFIRSLGAKKDDPGDVTTKLADLFRDLRFRVRSEPFRTPAEKEQAQIVDAQVERGRLPEIESLKAWKIEDAEALFQQRKQQDAAQMQMQAMAAQQAEEQQGQSQQQRDLQKSEHDAALKMQTEPPGGKP